MGKRLAEKEKRVILKLWDFSESANGEEFEAEGRK